MLETHLRRLGARWPIRLMWATAEESYLQPFGPRADEVIAAEFQQRGIESWRGEQVEAVEPGQVSFRSGMTLSCDNVIALAPERPAVSYDGLPQDARGFVRTAMENRAVLGHDGLYA